MIAQAFSYNHNCAGYLGKIATKKPDGQISMVTISLRNRHVNMPQLVHIRNSLARPEHIRTVYNSC